MSHKQKATSLLTLLVESCTAALNAFSLSEGLEDHLSADFSTLRTDFISILSILYSATTKIALSLKPSSPQYKASLVPLQDVSNNVAALVHSIRLMRVREGTTVLKEYENIAQNVVIAVRSLAQCLLDESRGNANEEYLVKTGEVHELIDRVRKPGGLSLNNRDAVRRSWLQDSGSLADAYEEIQEICKAADLDVEDEEEFGDGWDELGISSDKKLSASELDRAQKVQALIKLVVLLHKRVIKDFLSSNERNIDNAALDKLAELSGGLSAIFDDFVSSMYTPHHLEDVAQYLDALITALKDLKSFLFPVRERTLEEQLESLSLSPIDKSNKWFMACFEQVDKFASKISDTLQITDESSS